MAIKVLTKSTHGRLTTIKQIRSELGIQSTADNEDLEAAVEEASAYIESVTGRVFGAQKYRETIGTEGRHTLALQRVPIVSVDKVTQDGSTLSSTKYLVEDEDAGILYREHGWTPSRQYYTQTDSFGMHINRFPKMRKDARKETEIEYVAGYTLPSTKSTSPTLSSAPSLPKDVERAARAMAKQLYQRNAHPGDIERESFGDASITYGGQNKTVPNIVTSVIQRYKITTIV